MGAFHRAHLRPIVKKKLCLCYLQFIFPKVLWIFFKTYNASVSVGKAIVISKTKGQTHFHTILHLLCSLRCLHYDPQRSEHSSEMVGDAL